MPSSSTKKAREKSHPPPKDPRQLRSLRGGDAGSAPTILAPVSSIQHAKKESARMEQESSPGPAGDTLKLFTAPLPPELEVDTAAITGPILEAIAASKTQLMGRIDCLASECNLIRHDLDKIRGRLTTAEDRISEVEDDAHFQGSQLSDLQDMVRSLQHRADNANNRQRRNNVRVVGRPEGAEGTKPVLFAKQFFKNLLSLEDLPPTYVVERAHGSLQVLDPLVPHPGLSWSGF